MEIPIGKAFTEEELKKVEEALNISLSENNKKLLMHGDPSEILEINGKESRLTLKRKFNREVLAEVTHKKETLEIPDKIDGHKLTRNEKKSLMDGDVVLLHTKKGDAYIQIDKELNTITIKSSKEMNIPNVIGDNKKHNYAGYKLTSADKELLANGHMLPPKVLCSPEGFILAEFGITEDRKGVKFANAISIPKKEVQAYIEKYHSKDIVQEVEINKNEPGNFVEQKLETPSAKPLDFDDKQRLEYLSKNGISGVNHLFEIGDVEKKAEFLQKYDLAKDYELHQNLGNEYSENSRADNHDSCRLISQQMNEVDEKFKNGSKEKATALGETIEKPKDSEKTPEVEKVVVRNLDEEFLAALALRDFEKLNKMSKEDNYVPSKNTLETAHKLPNLSDHDKVAIKTIFPEKEKEPALVETGKESKEPVVDVVKDNKRSNVKIIEAEEKGGRKDTTHKLGNIASNAFRDM